MDTSVTAQDQLWSRVSAPDPSAAPDHPPATSQSDTKPSLRVPSLLPFPVLGCVCPRSLLQEISPCSAQPGASTWLVLVTPERGVPTEPAGAAPAPPCHSDCGAAATAADRRGKGSSSPAPGDAPHPPPVLRSRRSLVPRPAFRGRCAPGRARGRIPAPPCQAGLPSALVPGCEPRAGPRAPLWDTELTYMMSPLGTPSAPTPSPWQLWDPRAPNISKCFSWGWAGPSEFHRCTNGMSDTILPFAGLGRSFYPQRQQKSQHFP